jgi:serine/threonine protein kinase
LHHPHIVPVYAVGKDQGVHFYAMQFVEGMTLAAVLRAVALERREGAGDTVNDLARLASDSGSGSSPPSGAGARVPSSAATARAWLELVVGWVADAADAVEYSHREGVLHRDLKPGNLLLDRSGHLWVSDFGLAQVVSQDTGLTQPGEFLGTLAYCSPEQAAGQEGAVDSRSDVYSLGATLYQLVTLRLPFEDRGRGTLLHRVLHDEPPRPRRREPAIPVDLETIVLKAMAKEPADRYPSAAELAADLRSFAADRPILARPLSRPQRLVRWCRRNRVLAGTSAAALTAVAVGVLVAVFALGAVEQRDRAEAATERATLFRELHHAAPHARGGGRRAHALGRRARAPGDPRRGSLRPGGREPGARRAVAGPA